GIIFLFLQQARARIEDAAPKVLGGGGVAILILEVREVRLAKGATDQIQVKGHIIAVFRLEDVEEVASQLLTRWAGQPVTTPDGPDRMLAAVLIRQQLSQPGA